ncbi:hypothetical protein [Achromobacter phage Motura]|uniref:Uncharacterized protein n=1 Tax=Achromobacter phage Motura TaxID=2591403 RepID=A0A514CSL8_9CAUD|nr:hypothetical protein H1O15_gp052 [Achromobacter phage Motura]QDH83460.1 hypothetical protein [Achromobacter phage Motura]
MKAKGMTEYRIEVRNDPECYYIKSQSLNALIEELQHESHVHGFTLEEITRITHAGNDITLWPVNTKAEQKTVKKPRAKKAKNSTGKAFQVYTGSEEILTFYFDSIEAMVETLAESEGIRMEAPERSIHIHDVDHITEKDTGTVVWKYEDLCHTLRYVTGVKTYDLVTYNTLPRLLKVLSTSGYEAIHAVVTPENTAWIKNKGKIVWKNNSLTKTQQKAMKKAKPKAVKSPKLQQFQVHLNYADEVLDYSFKDSASLLKYLKAPDSDLDFSLEDIKYITLADSDEVIWKPSAPKAAKPKAKKEAPTHILYYHDALAVHREVKGVAIQATLKSILSDIETHGVLMIHGHTIHMSGLLWVEAEDTGEVVWGARPENPPVRKLEPHEEEYYVYHYNDNGDLQSEYTKESLAVLLARIGGTDALTVGQKLIEVRNISHVGEVVSGKTVWTNRVQNFTIHTEAGDNFVIQKYSLKELLQELRSERGLDYCVYTYWISEIQMICAEDGKVLWKAEPMTAENQVPVSKESMAMTDAALGIVRLPSIALYTETYTLLKKRADEAGMIMTAYIRQVLEKAK